MTTIDKVYCSPKTDEEWMSLLGYIPSDSCTRCVYYEDFGMLEIDSENEHLVNFDGMSEIEVSKFLDLAHDRITPWMLEEVGFVNHSTQYIGLFGSSHIHYTISNGHIRATPFDGIKGINAYITTFTDLLTQIKFLTPPTT